MAKNNSDDNNGLGCALLLVAIVFAMPLVGIYLIVKGSDEDKSVGIALLILGIVLWGYTLAHMN